MPLQRKNEAPITTGQVAGGPWIISRHPNNLATAANCGEWATPGRGLHGAPVRGRRTGAGVSFILPYLPFLIGFGIAPMIYALVLAFTTSSGGWAGTGNFTRTFKDYRFLPAFEHILLYTGVWLGALIVFVVGLALLLHGRANRVSTGFRF